MTNILYAKRFASLLFVLALLNVKHFYSQVIPEDRMVDWHYAGLNDTTTNGFIWLNMIDEGLDPTGLISNNVKLDSMINAYGSSGVIFFFPSGDYLFNQTIHLSSNQILKGDGMNQTQLIFDLGGTGDAIKISGSINNSNVFELLLDANRGQYFIVSDDAETLSSGEWIKIYQNDDDLVTSSWALNSVGQIIRVDQILGDTIYLRSPLRMDFEMMRSPKFKKIQMESNVGIECLKILRLDDTAPEQASNIAIRYASNSWIKNVESENCTFSHIVAENASNIKIGRSYFHHGFDYGGGGRAYGVSLQFTTNECLIEDNIFEHLRHSMLLQAGPNGNVFSYNFSTDPFWTSSSPLIPSDAAGDMVLHGNYPYANLFEQNSGQNIVIDNSHGANGPFNTFFRNRASLFGIFFSDGTSPSQNIVGNEIPNTGSPYSFVNYTIQGIDQFEYGNNNKGNITPSGTEILDEASYYYSETPSFINSSEWAGIGTPNTMEENNIPAQNRYESNAIYDYPCNEEPPVLSSDQNQSTLVHLFPNPTKELLYFKSDKKGILNLWNAQGKCLKTQKIILGLNEVNVSNYRSGIYRLTFSIEDNEMIKQVSFIVD